MELTTDTKLFPRRLPKDFHGPINNHTALSRAKRLHILTNKEQESGPSLRVKLCKRDLSLSGWERRRSDQEVNRINRQYMQHPSRVSQDNPREFTNTLSYYQRSVDKPRPKQRSRYNIFGERKASIDFDNHNFGLSSCRYQEDRPISLSWTNPNMPTTSKIVGNYGLSSISSFYKPREYQLTEKIGSDSRVYQSQRPTLMKIGHAVFVNTHKAE